MKSIVFIIIFFTALISKAQQVSFTSLEVNREYVVNSNFSATLSQEKITIGSDVYFIHGVKDNTYLTMKSGIVYEVVLNETSLTVTTLDKQENLIYFKD